MSNNDPNPLIPQGSLQQASAKSKSTMRLAIFIVAIVHVALIGGILMVGCKREETKPEPQKQQQVRHELPALDPTYYPPTPGGASTSAVPPDALAGPIPPIPGPTPTATNGGTGIGTIPGGPGIASVSDDMSHGDVLPPTPPAGGDGSEYAIAKGDTFSSIASKRGLSTAAIVKANPNVDPTRLRIGQKIKIPAKAATSASVTPGTASVAAGSGDGYTVKSGDTLTRIAKKHHVTVAALKSANGLRTDRIHAGQKLKVPGSAHAATAAPAPVDAIPPVPTASGALPSAPGTVVP